MATISWPKSGGNEMTKSTAIGIVQPNGRLKLEHGQRRSLQRKKEEMGNPEADSQCARRWRDTAKARLNQPSGARPERGLRAGRKERARAVPKGPTNFVAGDHYSRRGLSIFGTAFARSQMRGPIEH